MKIGQLGRAFDSIIKSVKAKAGTIDKIAQGILAVEVENAGKGLPWVAEEVRNLAVGSS